MNEDKHDRVAEAPSPVDQSVTSSGADEKADTPIRRLDWQLPGWIVNEILNSGLTSTFAVIAGREVTIEIVTPQNIVHGCFDNVVQILDEEGRPWVRAVISNQAASALMALVKVTERELTDAQGPIAIQARLSSNPTLEAAWRAYELLTATDFL